MFAALLAFALPLGLLPLARVESADARLWQRVTAYRGDSLVQRVLVSQGVGGQRLWVVGASSGLLVSADAGQSWSRADQGLPQGPLGEVRILDLALHPDDVRVAYAVVESPSNAPRPMLYWTADEGGSWQPRASLGQARLRAVALASGDPEPYVASSNDILHALAPQASAGQAATPQERFQRGGDDLRWERLAAFAGRTEATALAVGRSTVSASAPLTPTLFVGTRGKGLWCIAPDGQGLRPARATDGDLFQRTTVHAIGVHPRHPERLAVGTQRGFYLSADAGMNWRAVDGALRGEAVLSLAFDPARDETLYAGLAHGGVWFSRDGGHTWEALGRGLGGAAVYALVCDRDAGVLYAGTGNGLWRLVCLDRG